MKINGTVIVSPLMSQMEVGQNGFMLTEAVTVINGSEVFIDTNSSISEIKSEKKYVLPVKRAGPGEEDFEIDFNVAYYFFNNSVTQEAREKLKTRKNLIGPYPIKTEVYKTGDYRKQSYPRMDFDELTASLIDVNTLLEDLPDNEIALGDRKELRKLIKAKLTELPIKELEYYIKCFSPVSDEDNQNGEIVNYLADERILNFIMERIQSSKAQQKLEEMSREELEKELSTATQNEDFERSMYIQDIIKKK